MLSAGARVCRGLGQSFAHVTDRARRGLKERRLGTDDRDTLSVIWPVPNAGQIAWLSILGPPPVVSRRFLYSCPHMFIGHPLDTTAMTLPKLLK
jgi:hypothetical protein